LAMFMVLTVNRNRDYRSAESIWRDTVEKRPDNARAWLSLALAYVEQGRYSEAKPLLESAMTLDPTSVDIGADYAEVLAKLGEYTRAEEMYRWAVASKPDQYAIWYNLGTMLLDLKRYEEAATCLTRALPDKKQGAKAHYNLANCLLAMGRQDDAISSFHQAIKRDRLLGDAYVNLATALIQRNRFQEAFEITQAGFNAGLDNTPLEKVRALTLVGVGRSVEAIPMYEKLLKSEPENADLHADLGLAYASAGRSEQAIESFEVAINKGYGSDAPGKARAVRVSLASLLQGKGAFAEAAVHYQLAATSEPNNSELQFYAAHALLLAGRAVDAARALKLLMGSVEPTAEMHNDLGVAYLQLQSIDEAREHFRLALGLKPDLPEAKENLRLLEQTPSP